MACQASRPVGEAGAENDPVVCVDLAVAVLVDDANLPGLPPVPLRFEGVLQLPDTGELVVVVDLDGVADEPAVPHVVLVAAVQADDAIAVHRPVELRGPPQSMPVPEQLCRQRHLGPVVPGRPDVLQNARVAVRAGELPRHQQVVRGGPIDIHRSVDPAAQQAELQPHVHLAGPLPGEIRVHQGAGAVPHRRLVSERVHRSRQ